MTKTINDKINKKGITLIELIIAMAILGIVISAGYTVYSFGLRSFQQGTESAETFHNVRIVSETIKKHIPRAYDIELENSPPNDNDNENENNWSYIYLDDTDDSVYLFLDDNGGKTEIASNISKLDFEKKGDRRIGFTVEANRNGNTQERSSELTLLDPSLSDRIKDINEEATAIWFRR